jgi:hypothetical protein
MARRFFSERRPGRRFIWRSRRAAVLFVLVPGLLTLPIALPVLPPGALAKVPLQNINYNLGEEVGWQALVAQVATVYHSLPPAQRAQVAIVTGNYGEAGAIDRYGPTLGLPAAYSGHNNYWWWGPPRLPQGIAIIVGLTDRPSWLLRYFGSVRLVGRVHNPWGVANDEEGVPLWLCRQQRQPWPAIWPRFKSYG